MGSRPSKDNKKEVVLENGEVSMNHFRFENYSIYRDLVLGSGSFGKVYKGYDWDKKRLIAVKEINNSSITFSENEVQILTKLTEHDNIVRIYGTFIHDQTRYIVMQLCEGTTLDEYMQQKNPADEVQFELIFQMIETMQYMHFADPPTAHGDLKPGNIMIVHGSHVKLCDFGLAKIVDPEKTREAHGIGGSRKYMSPEIYSGNYNALAADVFAAGLVFLAIITFVADKTMGHLFQSALGVGYEMSEGYQDVMERKLEGVSISGEQKKALVRLISRMVHFNPKQRPDFNEISMIFIRDVKQDALVLRGRTKTPVVQRNKIDDVGKKERTGTAETPKDQGPSDRAMPMTSQRVSKNSGNPTGFRRLCHQELSFAAHWNSALSSDGSILLACASDPKNIYLFRHDGASKNYGLVSKVPLLGSALRHFCSKAINRSEIALQAADGEPTLRFDRTTPGHAPKTPLGHNGRLLELFDDGRVAYARLGAGLGAGRGAGWVIDVHGGATPLTLQPPGLIKWEGGLSVCRLPEGFAVVEVMSKSLIEYDIQGQVTRSRILAGKPTTTKAVTVVAGRYLVVACTDPPCLAVLGVGVEASLAVGAEVLGLGGLVMHGVAYSPMEGVLHVAAGKDELTISSLHAYEVKFSRSS